MAPVAVRGLNHAVLFVRDLTRSIEFYQTVFDFDLLTRDLPGPMALLRAKDSPNHHDLGLREVGEDGTIPDPQSVGLYHLAWEVGSFEELLNARNELAAVGALVGQSDHGASKSLYGVDPDGIEFEVMWLVPREDWGENERTAIVEPLRIDEERKRYGKGGS
jgi:catechol-2,3-dioxygenase